MIVVVDRAWYIRILFNRKCWASTSRDDASLQVESATNSSKRDSTPIKQCNNQQSNNRKKSRNPASNLQSTFHTPLPNHYTTTSKNPLSTTNRQNPLFSKKNASPTAYRDAAPLLLPLPKTAAGAREEASIRDARPWKPVRQVLAPARPQS